MITRSFFGAHEPSFEVLDYENSETIPDQSLTVREILTQFTRSGRELPDIEVGEDDDIDVYDERYDDMVDAVESYESAYYGIRNSVESSVEDTAEDESPGEDT